MAGAPPHTCRSSEKPDYGTRRAAFAFLVQSANGSFHFMPVTAQGTQEPPDHLKGAAEN